MKVVSQIAVLEMNGQSVPQRWTSMREGSNTARRQCSAWNVELSAIRRAKILASRESGCRVAHSRQVVRCHPMETLEHLDADSKITMRPITTRNSAAEQNLPHPRTCRWPFIFRNVRLPPRDDQPVEFVELLLVEIFKMRTRNIADLNSGCESWNCGTTRQVDDVLMSGDNEETSHGRKERWQ